MKKFFSSKRNKIIVAAVIAVILVIGSFWLGYYAASDHTPEIDKVAGLSNKTPPAGLTSVDFSPFWKAWNVLNEKFVETKNHASTTDQDRVWGAIEGLAQSYGDPYTVFFPPADQKIFNSEISGNFEGVGMEIDLNKDGIITVVAPLKGTPAERAGIKAGDMILKIDGTSTQDMNVDKAVSLIRGPKGTNVTVNIFREGVANPFDVTMTRDTINIPTIDTKMRSDGVFVISIYSFTSDSPNLFRDALEKFIDAKTDKMIIDLRGNPGGYLDAAVDMASFFLPAGDVVVRENFGSKAPEQVYTSKGYDIFNNNLKLAVLVDGGSASASEILAGALSEHGMAKLIGVKTFGKGSVQELVPITPDTSLKVTIAKWLTPNGISISESGLTPDIVVSVATSTGSGTGQSASTTDVQMERAAQYLIMGK